MPTGKQFNLSTLSPFRYPGGKSWLRERILRRVDSLGWRPRIFIEPFAGGGSVGLAVAEMNLADEVLLVERDPDVAAVWKAILGDEAEELMRKIADFMPLPETAKAIIDGADESMVSKAFRCLLCNRIRHGGIMTKGAGILKRGESGRGIFSRWYPETLVRRIGIIQNLRHRIRFIEGDAFSIIPEYHKEAKAVFFLDPPYTPSQNGPGRRLYRFHELDHDSLLEIASLLRGVCLITYSDCREIREIAHRYHFKITTAPMKTTHHRDARELLLIKQGIL